MRGGKENMTGRLWTPKTWIILGGFIFGILATLLTKWGNPANMGICVACFWRDVAGGIGLHRVEVVQYIRPEIIGFVFGAFFSAYAGREFKPRGGSSPLLRFFLGVFFMVGALVFLGCPVRALIRLAGGDLNGITALLGIILGAFVGIQFLKGGFNLGRSGKAPMLSALIIPLAMVALLLLLIFKPPFIFFSLKGPGSQHASLLVSLLAGIVVGFIAQKTRMCFVGGWRDIMLVRDFYLASGIAAFFVGVLLFNYLLGNFSSGLYHWGFTKQPIAHDNHLWNFLGMTLAGLTATLQGGCPLRQTIMAGEGDSDAGITVLGLIAGAALSHNFLLASSPKGPSGFGPTAVIIGLAFCLFVGFSMMERER
jgi:hypothetical protein